MNYEDIHYVDYGTNKKGVIVFLHGWGQNIEMMDMLGHPFEHEFRIVILDFPGFGSSPEPPESWGVKDYTDFLHGFLDKLEVKKPILVGHSFGGRVAICYSSLYETEKVVLLSSPFRPSINKKVSFKTKIYKFAKKIKLLKPLANKLRNKWGSPDYRNASEITRGSLVKIVNEDLTNYAKTINVPVLLIYGELDTAAPVSEGQTLEKIISDAGLVVYPGCHHYAYLENLNQTISILHNFFD